MDFQVFNDNNMNILPDIPSNSLDSIVCDPPYGIAFLNKKWDKDLPIEQIWAECLRVLKPGGHLLAFSAPRTYHRMTVGIEDAGFEIRDFISWVYASGFPKSQDAGKIMDKFHGVDVKTSKRVEYCNGKDRSGEERTGAYQPVTEAGQQWTGWKALLKPSHEPICLARKPLEGTIGKNLDSHGVGVLNIDGCRVPYTIHHHKPEGSQTDWDRYRGSYDQPELPRGSGQETEFYKSDRPRGSKESQGGFDAYYLTHNEYYPEHTFDKPGAEKKTEINNRAYDNAVEHGEHKKTGERWEPSDLGRYPSNVIGEIPENQKMFWDPYIYNQKATQKDRKMADGSVNRHPTLKPVELMRYLVRMVTPEGGTVLDPFMGSGSTGVAALLEGCNFIGIELEDKYFDTAKQRLTETLKS